MKKRFFFAAFTLIYSMLSLTLTGQVLEKRLIDAVELSDLDKLKALERTGLSLRAKDYYLNTLLNFAVKSGSPEMIEYLLSRRVSPKDLNTSRQGPLHILALRPEVLPSILDYSVIGFFSPEAQGPVDDFVPDSLKIARLLIDKGAGIDTKDIFGATPLLLASSSGAVWLMGELLVSGADVNSSNLNSWTPLLAAAAAGHAGAVELLLKEGADPNHKSVFGDTALHLAAASGSVKAVDLLLEAGAERLTVNQNGRIPLDLTENEEIQSLLRN